MAAAGSDESSDDEDAVASPEAAGKWLRKASAQQKQEGSVEAISSFLSKLDADLVRKALGQGNSNGKAPLHFASQLRGDDGGLELVELFLRYGADVNVATRRGHTPLIFAAGRGHNGVVQLLLSQGANPRVVVVTGDTPVSMGRTRLDPQTFAMLEAAEKSFDGPWLDNRNKSDALQAQAEHMKTCPHCRRKVQQKEAAAEQERRDELLAGLTQRLADIFAMEPIGTHEFVTLVAETSGTRNGRSILDDALQKAISASLSDGTATLIELLKLLDEESLGRALHKVGHRDRRPIRTILGALLKELEVSPHRLEGISVAEIAAAASPHLALEVLRFKPQFLAEDRFAVEDLWQSLCKWAQLPERYTPEISLAAGTSMSRKQGGPGVTELLQRLRWACSMEPVTPRWAEMVEAIVEEAFRNQQAGFLYDGVKYSKMIPSWAIERLGSSTEDGKHAGTGLRAPRCHGYATSAASTALPDEAKVATDIPEYTLPVEYEWVADDAALADLRQVLEARFQSEQLFVGVDTEWGVCSKTPSVVQLAIPQQAWVIDTATPSGRARAFFRWLFKRDHASFLGFAFSADAAKLSELMKDDESDAIEEFDVLDLQKLAMQHINDKGRTPGLKAVAGMWLGVNLDKTEQCSDWDRRPLSESQMRYAAADATVLLDIASAMGLEPPKRDLRKDTNNSSQAEARGQAA
eukprot:CAMPEP_0197643014 /NCGR_PEP_ID=MMETSP1338-20131121/16492_1 /TAXON_ID=43686 ORGANISM="Pelagodinium beii, Strain RCC1491" /NCGR_SAMPLE_ID=MMETSP1338 /ASSEMBLY_ACC=CAM_ASM_000754 /LENGTH=692 /DNA_ID=CAMNT_0043216223 /DNA_START=180 /DNA_END=2258 /DNA_ORIENTATION=+